MKNNYHQTFVVVCVMTYIHVEHPLFIYLFRSYKNMFKKSNRQNKNDFYKTKKIKIKYINTLKRE